MTGEILVIVLLSTAFSLTLIVWAIFAAFTREDVAEEKTKVRLAARKWLLKRVIIEAEYLKYIPDLSLNRSMFRDIERRVLEAEKIDKRNRPDKVKRKWRTDHCPKCQRKVEYFPRKNFTGDLKCLHCGEVFRAPSLDSFL